MLALMHSSLYSTFLYKEGRVDIEIDFQIEIEIQTFRQVDKQTDREIERKTRIRVSINHTFFIRPIFVHAEIKNLLYILVIAIDFNIKLDVILQCLYDL